VRLDADPDDFRLFLRTWEEFKSQGSCTVDTELKNLPGMFKLAKEFLFTPLMETIRQWTRDNWEKHMVPSNITELQRLFEILPDNLVEGDLRPYSTSQELFKIIFPGALMSFQEDKIPMMSAAWKDVRLFLTENSRDNVRLSLTESKSKPISSDEQLFKPGSFNWSRILLHMRRKPVNLSARCSRKINEDERGRIMFAFLRDYVSPVRNRSNLPRRTKQGLALRVAFDGIPSHALSPLTKSLQRKYPKVKVIPRIPNATSLGFFLGWGHHVCVTFFGTAEQLRCVLEDLVQAKRVRRAALRISQPTEMQQRVIVSTVPHIYYQELMDQGCACFVFHPDSPVIGLLASLKDSEKKTRGNDELKSSSEAKSSCGAPSRPSSTVVELITDPPKQSLS